MPVPARNNANAATWSHHNPVHVIAGAGVLGRLTTVTHDGPLLLVTTHGSTRRGVTEQVLQIVRKRNINVQVLDAITPNPDLDDLDDLIGALAGSEFATIVALGGGSVLDTAKTLAVCLHCKRKQPLRSHFRYDHPLAFDHVVPMVAIPTTSGTGAEVTPFATIWDGLQREKYSLAGSSLYPNTALLDPSLTLSLPRNETLVTGLDALSHALESLWNKHATPLSELFATRSIALICDHLPTVLDDPECMPARELMQQASMLSGIAISQTRTAIAHAASYPFTLNFDVPHGLACSFTLSAIIGRQIQGGWLPGRLYPYLARAEKLLDSLDLPAMMDQYVSVEQACLCLGRMMIPSRTSNYNEPVETGMLREILNASLRQP